MANQEHLEILKQGTDVWNKWREQYPDTHPDFNKADLNKANLSFADLSDADLSRADLSFATLSGATLSRATLSRATLSRANLSHADLSDATLSGATLSGADLSEAALNEATLSNADLSFADLFYADLSFADLSFANLFYADLSFANLSNADLSGANLWGTTLSGATLSGATLSRATLSRADLSRADLSGTTLVGTNLTEAILTECHIYGIFAWDVELTGATQDSLVITPEDEPIITVDNLKIAQFIYLLLNNQEIRDAIDTIAKKAVLILGRFTPERKAVLDALRDELRRCGYLPILFDFKKPSNRNLTETVSTLAHLSRFIIADLTDPRSIPNELRAIIPILRVPVQPLLNVLEEPYGMFEDFQDYPWVLPTYRYTDLDSLLASLQGNVIDPAERKAQELTKPS